MSFLFKFSENFEVSRRFSSRIEVYFIKDSEKKESCKYTTLETGIVRQFPKG